MMNYKDEANRLTKLGEKIFLDRYSFKRVNKHHVREDDVCLIQTDKDKSTREVGFIDKLYFDNTADVKVGENSYYRVNLDSLDFPTETVEDAMDRMAYHVASIETNKDFYKLRFREILNGYKFVPAGRIWASAGTGQATSYVNCVVLKSPKDSREGIFHTLTEMGELHSRGSGVGVNVSSLRPRYSYVKGVNGRSSGSVSWASLYSYTTGLIEQGGSRRGATMIILNDWHPDIEEFIECKKKDGYITNANISVGISNEFMIAVKNDLEWQLQFPDTTHEKYNDEWDGVIENWIDKGCPVKVFKTLKARDLWNKIIESAWASAEPGIWFRGRANQFSNSWYYPEGELVCTNPCLAEGTLVSTPKGLVKVEDIKDGDEIFTVFGKNNVTKVEVHENMPVYLVKFSDGGELLATASHRFHARKKEQIKNPHKKMGEYRLDELEPGDQVRVTKMAMPNNKIDLPNGWSNRDFGFFIGCLIGDGSYTDKMLGRNRLSISTNVNDIEWNSILRDLLKKTGATTITEDLLKRKDGSKTNSLKYVVSDKNAVSIVKNSLLEPAKSINKRIPLSYINSNEEFLKGLVDGLISTDGNINLSSNHPQIRFDTASKGLAEDLRRVFLMFGIHGKISTSLRKPNKIDGREINNKNPKYTLSISGEGVRTFCENINISHPEKAKRILEIQKYWVCSGNNWMAKIVSIEPAGKANVRDLYEEISDTWITDGYVNQGCGEQPLASYSVCNLGHINLSAFVDDNGTFDWASLRDTVKYSVRFLDNIIDLTGYYLPEIEEKQKAERRVGLGTMGLAEMLIKLKLRYGSKEANDFIDKLYRVIMDEAYEESQNLGFTKGNFLHFDEEYFNKSLFIETNFSNDEISCIRNVTLLTQAPTGTVGTMVNTSTGIEPYFALEWERTSRLGTHIERCRPYQKYLDNGGDPINLPDYFITSMDLTPKEHVEVVGIIQKYTDSSISKTVNIPNNWEISQVKELYEYMYELGCKGGTVYRDGSRNEQILNLVKDKEPEKIKVDMDEIKEIKAFKISNEKNDFPKIRSGKTISIETPGGTCHVIINFDPNGLPYEVFIEVGKAGTDVKAMAEALGRLISLMLRESSEVKRAVMIENLVEQLKNIGGASSIGFGKNKVSSLPDAVSKALETICLGQEEEIVEQIQPPRFKNADLCKACGNMSMLYSEGCKKCFNCGESEC